MEIINPNNSFRKQKFFRSRANILLVAIMFLLNIGNWMLLYFKFKPQTDPIYLHYNIYYGIDLIGSWYLIYIMPLVGLLMIILNTIFAVLLYKKEKIVSMVVIGITIFLLIVILFSSFLISRQNI